MESWPAPQGRGAGKVDGERPVKTPCDKKEYKIAICPQFAVALSSDIQRLWEVPPLAAGLLML